MLLEVYRYGSEVKIGGDVLAVVTAACIRNGRITYECSWWDGRRHQCGWFEECEVEPSPEMLPSVDRIGFK